MALSNLAYTSPATAMPYTKPDTSVTNYLTQQLSSHGTPTVSPEMSVTNYLNQQMSSLSRGTGAQTEPATGVRSQPGVDLPSSSPVASQTIQANMGGANSASNSRMLMYAQQGAIKRQKAEAARQAALHVQQQVAGGMPQMSFGTPGQGTTLQRVQPMLGGGLHITSTYRTPAENARVGGAAHSLHMDKNNPAVDIAGPTAQLDALAARLRQIGGYRQLLWRVAGHYDHVHIAY